MGQGVTTDSSGNIYVTGHTWGGLDGTGHTWGEGDYEGKINLGYTDVFLVKYNSSGTKQWTKQLGTSYWDYGNSVTTDSSDNIYVNVVTSGDLDGNTSSGGNDTFLVKYNSSGTKQWTKQLGTSNNDYGNSVTSDSSDNIYVTGYTDGGLDGNTSSGYNDIFLVKYNSSGTKQWTKQLGTSYLDEGYSVTTDSLDNIYVTGWTNWNLDGNTSSGGRDIFLLKYNSSGTKQWTKQLGSSSVDEGYGVTTDSLDNIYVTGITYGDLDGNTKSGNGDIFLVKYDSSGTKQWTKQLGTSSRESGTSVATDSSGNIYVTGHTQGCNSCSTVMATRGLDGNTNSGSLDVFLVKYNSSGTKQWTKQLGTSISEWGQDVTSDSSGNIYVTGSTEGGLDGNINSGSYDIFLVKYNLSGTKQ